MSEPLRVVVDPDRILAHPWQWWRETQALLERLEAQKEAREAARNGSPGQAEADGSDSASAQSE